jgi:hypothetical protein
VIVEQGKIERLAAVETKLPTSGNGGSIPFNSIIRTLSFRNVHKVVPCRSSDGFVACFDDREFTRTESIFARSAGEKSFVELTSTSAVINAARLFRRPRHVLDKRAQSNYRTDTERDAQKEE